MTGVCVWVCYEKLVWWYLVHYIHLQLEVNITRFFSQIFSDSIEVLLEIKTSSLLCQELIQECFLIFLKERDVITISNLNNYDVTIK